MRCVIILGALTVIGQCGCSSSSPIVARGPVVIVSIDTLRADRLPAYGYEAGRTPAIDALANEGILFERAYTHTPLTLPAHVSMLSGQLPQQHRVRDNVGFRVDADVRMLPALLRTQGYVSAGIVSAAVLRGETGLGAAFDFYDDRMPPARGGAALDEAQRDGLESLRIARQWLEQRTSPTWFLFLHLYEPHAPYQPPGRYSGLAAYDGEVAYADEIVGRLVEWLRARGAYHDATIVLLSDHGEGLGDHGEQEHGLFLYEEAIRVPLIVKLPRGRNGGARVSTVSQHVDLVPTLLDLSGIAVPQDLPGRTLRALLEGNPRDWSERSVYSETLFGHYQFGWSEIFALTDSRFRFIKAPRPELYDLQADPKERQNLAGVRAQTARAMGDALLQLVTSTPTASEPLAPDMRERLASLGYVGPAHRRAASPSSDAASDPKDKVQVLQAYRTAITAVADGKLDEAVERLRQIARAEPRMADVWLAIGRVLLRQGRTADAVDAFKQYVRDKPTSAAGLLEVAAALLALQRTRESTTHAQLAVQVAQERPDKLAALEMLCRIALAAADAAAARQHAAAAAAIDPEFPLRDYVEGRIAYNAQRFDDAVPWFDRAVQASQRRTVQIRGLHLYAGDALAHVGRFADAEHEFRQEIRFFPESTSAYLSLANLYQAFGRFDEADQVFSAMSQALPSPETQAAIRQLRAARPAGGEKR